MLAVDHLRGGPTRGEPAVEAFSPVREVARSSRSVSIASIRPTRTRWSEAPVNPLASRSWSIPIAVSAGMQLGSGSAQQRSKPRPSSNGSAAAPASSAAAAVSVQPRSKRFVILFRHGPARAVVFRTRHDRRHPPTRNETPAGRAAHVRQSVSAFDVGGGRAWSIEGDS